MKKIPINRKCLICNKKFITNPSLNKRLCSVKCANIWQKGKSHSPRTQFKKGAASWNKGKITPVRIRKKLSQIKLKNPIRYWLNKPRPSRRGKNSNFWKGGIDSLHHQIRNSLKYKQWRQNIFIRDDFTCQKCKEKGGRLNAHHKKSFAKLLKEARQNLPLFDLYEIATIYTPLWDLDNGITLCKNCHRKTKSYLKTS